MKKFTRIQLTGNIDYLVFPKKKDTKSLVTLMEEFKSTGDLSAISPNFIESQFEELFVSVYDFVAKEVLAVEKMIEKKELTPTKLNNRIAKINGKYDELINSTSPIVIEIIKELKNLLPSDYQVEKIALGIDNSEAMVSLFDDEDNTERIHNLKAIHYAHKIKDTSELVDHVLGQIKIGDYKGETLTRDGLKDFLTDNGYVVEETSGLVALFQPDFEIE